MDYVETVSDQCVLYTVDHMTESAKQLAQVLLESTEHIEGAVRRLRDMKHANTISELCIEVNRLENQGDSILRQAVAGLFDKEKDPVAIIKWKEIYENRMGVGPDDSGNRARRRRRLPAHDALPRAMNVQWCAQEDSNL